MPLKINSQYDAGQAAVLNRWADDIEQQLNAISTRKVFAVANRAVAAAPAPAPTPTSGGPDSDLISAVNTQSFGSLDSTVWKANSGPISSGFVLNISPAQTNELAFVMGDSSVGALGGPLLNPGGWTAVSGGFSKVLTSAGPQTVSINYANGGPWRPSTAAVALFKTNGSAPVLTSRGSGSGGATVLSTTFTPTLGNALMFVADTEGQGSVADISHMTDNVGNVWIKLFDVFASFFDTGAGVNRSSQVVMWFCENPVIASTTITTSLNPPVPGGVGGFGTWAYFEISNLSSANSGAYTFQSSDNTKLVEFVGGANVTGTLPTPALTAGWQAMVANNGGGVVTLTSAAPLNNSSNTVLVAGGASIWIFSDGASYWTAPVSTPQSVVKSTSFWLDGYSSYSGTYTRSQPDFSDLAGLTKASKYNNITLVSNGLASEVATVDLTARTATINTTTLYAVPAAGAGQYRLSWNAKVTTAATTSTLGPLTIVYTDPDGVVQTITAAAQSNAGVIETSDTGNTTTTVLLGLSMLLNCKASTNITYAFTYASNAAATMQYNLHLKLEQM